MKRNPFTDPSLWVLLISNIVTIFFAVKENWNLSNVMWVYWAQSVIIGLFHFVRILQLKEFSTEGFFINDRPVEPTEGTKLQTAFFFLVHYGVFHLVYFIFLAGGIAIKNVDAFSSFTESIGWSYVFLAALVFFANHLFSYLYNRPKDTKKQNIGTLLFYPYARIIPMHLMVGIGAGVGQALPFFLILKTLADCLMHVQHHYIKKGEA